MSTVNSSLPIEAEDIRNPDRKVRTFFENYFSEPISFEATEVDTVVGFFKKRGFKESAAISTATVLLRQAKIDKVKVYKLVDTLQGLTDVQLSALVAEVLNYNRPKVSTLGFKTPVSLENAEARNIIV